MKKCRVILPVTIGGRQAIIANFFKDNEPLMFWYVIRERIKGEWDPWYRFDIRKVAGAFQFPPIGTPDFYKTALYNVKAFIDEKINDFEELRISGESLFL